MQKLGIRPFFFCYTNNKQPNVFLNCKFNNFSKFDVAIQGNN
jgi:hypothetical protein